MSLENLSCLVCVLVDIRELYIIFYIKKICVLLTCLHIKMKQRPWRCKKKENFAKIKIFWSDISESLHKKLFPDSVQFG